MATKIMEVVGVTMADMEITPEAGVTTLAVAVDGAKTTEMIMVVWVAWVDLIHGVHKVAETTLVGEKILAGSTTPREVETAEITLEAGVTTLAADGATTPAETEITMRPMVVAMAAIKGVVGVDPCVVTTTTWYVLKDFIISLPPNCANQKSE